MAEKKFFEKSKNGVRVFIEDETLAHMEAHPDVRMEHVKETIRKVTLDGTFFMESVSLGRTVGKDHCIYVPASSWNEVKMEQRPNRKGLTPMIEAEPVDTDLLTIGICVDDDGLWTLFTAFYGVKAPREPWDARSEEEKAVSEKFWSCHALCK